MVRVLFAMLVGIPLLTPPGVCLCDFLPCTRGHDSVAAARKTEAEPEAQASNPKGCRCHRHRTEESATKSPAETADAQGRALEHDSHCPSRPDHAPTCPAKNHLAAKIRSSVASMQPIIGLSSGLVEPLTPVAAKVGRVLSSASDFRRPADSPIYLTFCALVI